MMSEVVYNQKLQSRLKKYCNETGSQNKAAQDIGVSSSVISQYLRGIYGQTGGDLDKTEQTLQEFFKVLDERQQQPVRQNGHDLQLTNAYAPITVSEHVYKTIRYCQLEKSITMIYGDAGIGKTMGALKFLKDFPTTAVYVKVSPVTGVLSRFIRKVADTLRVPSSKDIGQLEEDIRTKLIGTNKVLIIDEAQHLRFNTMEELRDWSDADLITGKAGVSIVLIGNKKMYTRMQGRNEERCSQQFNRSRPQPVSTRMCSKEDVKKVFPALANSDMSKELDFLYSVCRSRWAMRNAAFIYTDAVNSNDMTVERLRGIAQSRGIAVA